MVQATASPYHELPDQYKTLESEIQRRKNVRVRVRAPLSIERPQELSIRQQGLFGRETGESSRQLESVIAMLPQNLM